MLLFLYLTIKRQTHSDDFMAEIDFFLDGQPKLLQVFIAQLYE